MLASWTEILPLFVIRYLAQHCERFLFYRGDAPHTFASARPDVYFYIKEKK